MPVDRAVSILARFNAAQHALVSQFRELTPGSGEHQPADREMERRADRLSRGDGQRLGRRSADWRDAARAAGACRVHRTVRPDRRPSAEDLPAARSGRHRICDAALERLRASGHRMSKAIATLTPERGAGLCVTLPFGTISLFELADLTGGARRPSHRTGAAGAHDAVELRHQFTPGAARASPPPGRLHAEHHAGERGQRSQPRATSVSRCKLPGPGSRDFRIEEREVEIGGYRRCSILAQASRSETVRLNTSAPGSESGSTQK